MTEFDPHTRRATERPARLGPEHRANRTAGDADGSTPAKPALEESLEDAGDIAGVQTHTEEDTGSADGVPIRAGSRALRSPREPARCRVNAPTEAGSAAYGMGLTV